MNIYAIITCMSITCIITYVLFISKIDNLQQLQLNISPWFNPVSISQISRYLFFNKFSLAVFSPTLDCFKYFKIVYKYCR